MKTYRTLCSIDRDGKTFPAGSEIPLPDETAEGLLARNPPAIARLAPPAAAAPVTSPAVVSEPPKTAKQLIAEIEAFDATDVLGSVRAREIAREGGPRKTVLDAIDAKLDELAAATGDDDDAAAGGDGGDDSA